MIDTLTVGTRDLCLLWGVSDETIRTWSKAGCPKEKHGRWNLKAVFDWWMENINQDKEEGQKIQDVKQIYWAAKAEGEQIKVDTLKGNLVAWPDIEREWTGRLREVISGLQCLGDRLTPLVFGKTRNEIKSVIEKEIYELRTAYARNGKYCKEIKA